MCSDRARRKASPKLLLLPLTLWTKLKLGLTQHSRMVMHHHCHQMCHQNCRMGMQVCPFIP